MHPFAYNLSGEGTMVAYDWANVSVENKDNYLRNVKTEDLLYSPLIQHRSGIYKDDKGLIVSPYMICFNGRMHRLYNCRDGGLTMYFNPEKSGICGNVLFVTA